jgi:acetyl-CoA carboxylase biotin carboxyl carrier protein
MKTMNHVPSTKDGVVKKIFVTDGEAVEFDQDLILVE